MLNYIIMTNKLDKCLILNEIKFHFGIKKDGDFAKLIGISPGKYANWLRRNSFDAELLAKKFPEIDAYWILTGEGQMLKNIAKPEAAANIDKTESDKLKATLFMTEQQNKILEDRFRMMEARIEELKLHNHDLRKNNDTLNAVVLSKIIGEKP